MQANCAWIKILHCRSAEQIIHKKFPSIMVLEKPIDRSIAWAWLFSAFSMLFPSRSKVGYCLIVKKIKCSYEIQRNCKLRDWKYSYKIEWNEAQFENTFAQSQFPEQLLRFKHEQGICFLFTSNINYYRPNCNLSMVHRLQSHDFLLMKM